MHFEIGDVFVFAWVLLCGFGGIYLSRLSREKLRESGKYLLVAAILVWSGMVISNFGLSLLTTAISVIGSVLLLVGYVCSVSLWKHSPHGQVNPNSAFKIKYANKPLQRHYVDMLIFALAFLVVFIVSDHLPEHLAIVLMLLLAVLGVFLAVRQARRFGRFVCPECNSELKSTDSIHGRPAEFECNNCKTIWKFGDQDRNN